MCKITINLFSQDVLIFLIKWDPINPDDPTNNIQDKNVGVHVFSYDNNYIEGREFGISIDGNYIWFNILLLMLFGSMVLITFIKIKLYDFAILAKYESYSYCCYDLCKELSLLLCNFILIIWLDKNISDQCFSENFSTTKLYTVSYMQLYLYSVFTILLIITTIYEYFMMCSIFNNNDAKRVQNTEKNNSSV